MNKKYTPFVVIGLLLLACSPKVVAPVEVKNAETMPLNKELAEGKNSYETNCAKCHDLYEPSSHSKEQWKKVLVRMQPKAKISDAETASVYNYLTSNL